MKKLYKNIILTFGIVLFIGCEKEEVLQNNTEVMKTKNKTVSGEGGSLAQFTVVDNYLYTIDYKSIQVFDISSPSQPTLAKTLNLGIGLETIHTQNEYIFVGTTNGVRILDNSNPVSLEEISEFEHITSCDPVIANSTYAFSTLRGGTDCRGSINVLDIIDINNIEQPQLVSRNELVNPYGLGFSENADNLLYICDGYDGLKAFDVTNPAQVELVMHLKGIEAKDIIPNENMLIVLSTGGIYQFDASDPLNLIERSVINIH